ncbi:protein of unknown function [Acidithiobacillus ferrivorans]|uniref:Uncharacterized protein n=1 Tax=Acidithiobacillus ferrivorans TaxID=160808 RepID=A0A060UT40_9PROT|nr:hypothetical protein [Acidithiobacillus ferrivorans]CDQ09948.1 hypothetical protein AFERRI_370052 [Acidithiobacillus ferrivorans]SMH65724.1 protein of unknown function [Acidithiobacillus ferrivorans]
MGFQPRGPGQPPPRPTALAGGCPRGQDKTALARDLLGHLEDGCAKLFVTWRAMDARRRFPEVFAGGAYLPLAANGA